MDRIKVMRIRELRENCGKSQIQLASEMGVSQGVISEWENEIYLPKTRQLPLLCQCLTCSYNDLFVEQAS